MSSEQPAISPSNSPFHRRNVTLFALLCLAAIAGVIGYALYSRPRGQVPPGVATIPLSAPDDDPRLAELRRQPHLLFRNTVLGPAYGRLAIVALDAPDGARYATPLSCERVYGGLERGICLQASRGVLTTYQWLSFDRNFRVLHHYNLAGVPSRTRVSRDCHMAAFTVFVSGDSYSSGSFSTRTTIFDLRSETVVGDLESFNVRKNGQSFKAVDFNFWGVTFAKDSDRFYATLGTGGKVFLVEGRASLREITVLRDGVECPSLSPDNTRLVFKSRTFNGGRLIWRLHVLDLKTQAESVVNETRNVDDQGEWLDDDHVLYTLSRNVDGDGSSDVWLARADGTGTPRVLVRDATSPCVVRP